MAILGAQGRFARQQVGKVMYLPWALGWHMASVWAAAVSARSTYDQPSGGTNGYETQATVCLR